MQAKEAAEIAIGVGAGAAYTEVGFFTAVFFIAFATGIARLLRDDEYSTFCQCFSLGLCSGSLGFCCVALVLGPGVGIVDFDWFYLGLSALVGFDRKRTGQVDSLLAEEVL